MSLVLLYYALLDRQLNYVPFYLYPFIHLISLLQCLNFQNASAKSFLFNELSYKSNLRPSFNEFIFPITLAGFPPIITPPENF